MAFQTQKQEDIDNLPKKLQDLKFEKPHRLRSNAGDGYKPSRKKKTVVTRQGYGPFNLAKGAKVKRILTNWQEAIPFFEKESVLSIDLETGGLSPIHDHVFVTGIYGVETETACIVHSPDGTVPGGLMDWLENSGKLFITQNGVAFDVPFLHFAGLNWEKMNWYDTLIAEQAITQTNRKGVPKDLQSITKRRLGIDISKEIDHRDWYTDHLTKDQISYVAEDISFLPDIRKSQLEKAKEVELNWGANPVYGTTLTDAIELEMALAPTVIRMQTRGLPIDEEAVRVYFEEQLMESAAVGNRLTLALGEINLNSHSQIKKAFLDRFEVNLLSTTEDHLIEARDLFTGTPVFEVIEDLITYKHASKRATVYNYNFLEEFVKDGWLYGTFSQLGTDTGRFSSKNPNLQQLPKYKGKGSGAGARHLIGNHEGLSIVSVDYSQIEFRVAANIANDKKAFELFDQSHYDIHTMVASSVFGVEPNKVSKDQRQLSKAMSFTLLFGGGAYLLSAYATSIGADLPLAKAKPIVIDFFDQFEGLAAIRNRAYSIAARQNPFTIQLPTGLRRVLIPNRDLKATLILNNMVQGTAAAGLKYALLEAQKEGLDRYIGAVVHDEIVAAVPTAIAESYSKQLQECMIRGMVKVCENAKVEVEASIGKTWG